MTLYYKIFLRLVLSIILIISAGSSVIAATKSNVDFYVKWERLTTDEILEKGRDYLQRGTDNCIDSATVCFTIVTSRLKSTLNRPESQEQYVYALSKLGKIYLSGYYDYSKAYANLIEAKDIAEHTQKTTELSNIYLNLGILFVHNYILTRDPNALAEGEDFLLKSFNKAMEQNSTNAILASITNLLTLSMFYGNLEHLREPIERFQALKLPDAYAKDAASINMLIKAAQFYADHDYEHAMQYFTSLAHEDSVTDSESARRRIMINNHRIHTLDALDRRNDAIAILYENEKLATEYGLKDVIFHTYKDLSSLYSDQGDTAMADKYLIKYYTEKDSMSANNELGNIYEMKFRYDLDKSTQALAAMSQREREQRIIMWAIIAIVLIMVVMLAIKLRDNRQLRRNNELLYQKSLESLANEETRPKYKTSALTDADKTAIAKRVQTVLDSSPEIYELDFNMNRLAELVDAPVRSVSQVLNEVYGKNFNNIVTECRIREACRRLQQPDAKTRFTIEALAESVGFKSRTNFATNFKAITGLTPTQYIKFAQ